MSIIPGKKMRKKEKKKESKKRMFAQG